MRRLSRLVLSVGLAMSMFAPAVLAAPPVLDRVPGNAIAVITTPSLAKLHKNATAFISAVDLPLPMPIPELNDLLEQLGIPANKGFDPQKSSIALAFVPPAPNGDAQAQPNPDDMLVVLLETTNYADFVGNFEVKPGAAGGIDTGKLNGSDAFFKDLGGGFLAMAPAKATIERAQWKEGNAAAHNAAIGKAGQTLVDNSDLSMIIFTQQAKQFMPELEKAIDDQMAGNAGGQAIGQLKDSPLGQFITGPMIEDSTATVTGIRVDTNGISLDTSLAFKEGSETAKMLADISGSSDQMLSKLPAQPYFFAMAADMSSPGARKLIDQMLANAGEDVRTGVPGFVANWLKNSEGAAMVVGMPPGGLMTGLFTSTVGYVKTSNADAFVKNMQDGLEQLNGKSMKGLATETSFTPGGAEIEGAKVDTWGIKIMPDDKSEEDPGQISMALPFIFGQTGGPSGYLARTNGGLIQTFGRNQELMSKAMKVGAGTDNFTSDKVLNKVSEQLPKKRLAEFYIGVKSLLDSAIPLMAMDNIAVDVEVPPSLPPVGMGIAGGEGGVHMGLYIPAQTLKTVMAVVKEVQASQMGGGPADPDAAKKNDGKKGAGQPRF